MLGLPRMPQVLQRRGYASSDEPPEVDNGNGRSSFDLSACDSYSLLVISLDSSSLDTLIDLSSRFWQISNVSACAFPFSSFGAYILRTHHGPNHQATKWAMLE